MTIIGIGAIMQEKNLIPISVKIPNKLKDQLGEKAREEGYQSISEFIRETLEEKVLPEAAVAINEKKIYQKMVRLLVNLETQMQQNHVEDPKIRKTIQELKKEVKEHGYC